MHWRFPTLGAVAAIFLLLLLFLFTRDPALWFLFLVMPCLALLLLVLLVLLMFRRTRGLAANLLVGTLLLVGITTIGWRFQATLRPKLRWSIYSQTFKRQVLAQPSNPSGDFKHIEWDGWGGGPVGDWSVYVVFDPTDSLNAEAGHKNPGRIRGIPCEAENIQKLEPHWYSVTLMNAWWERCETETNTPTTG
jgi:hypothetical protein